MKTKLLSLITFTLASMLSTLPVSAQICSGKIVGQTPGSSVNLRSQPKLHSPVISSGLVGQRLTIIGHQGDWSKVRLVNGNQGWIFNKYVYAIDPYCD